MWNISIKLMKRWSSSQKLLLAVIALIVWSFFLWRAVETFKPGVYSATAFNSDCAIPVLMSNDDRPITLYNLYYYGTDRSGGWPFLFAQLIRRSTGYRWTDQSLSLAQISWLFVGVLALAGLSRNDGLVIALVFLLALLLHTKARYLIFFISQIYAWQVTALLLSWYSLRRLFENDLDSTNYTAWKRGVWIFLTFWFSYLASWSSAASPPFLLFILCLEVFRMRLRSTGKTGNSRLLRTSVRALLAVLAATAAERMQKIAYHRHALKHYGSNFKTPLHLDVGYLTKNLWVHLNSIIKLSWWPLHLLANLAVLAIILVLAYAWLRRREQLKQKLKAIVSEDTTILIIGAYGIALINFLLAVAYTHVRINAYDDRFLTPTSLFGPVAGMLAVFVMVKFCARRSSIGAFAKPAFLVAGLLLLFFKFPAPIYRYEYPMFTQTASALAEKSPRGILLGDYWDVYVFAALQSVNALTPVPLEGRENRMPWTRDMVRRADQVVLEYRHSKIVDADHAPETLSQHGASFRLAEPKFYENGVFAFALYVREK